MKKYISVISLLTFEPFPMRLTHISIYYRDKLQRSSSYFINYKETI